ncbi:MAG TPA: GPW/gp25 family protein [Acidocella sp.]|jgi:phage baseplate assembly protein W|nr:GPW/gp25 family protein [Acidocella sp.]
MTRNDIAFPFRIAAGSGQAAQASYQDHVDQLIRQVLLTDPGERVNLPQFGAGLRRLLFAPISSSLAATTTIAVTQALTKWIPTQIKVLGVTVTTPLQNAALPDGTVQITVQYQLVETRAPRQTVVLVS